MEMKVEMSYSRDRSKKVCVIKFNYILKLIHTAKAWYCSMLDAIRKGNGTILLIMVMVMEILNYIE